MLQQHKAPQAPTCGVDGHRWATTGDLSFPRYTDRCLCGAQTFIQALEQVEVETRPQSRRTDPPQP
jgi:hypothetical protein